MTFSHTKGNSAQEPSKNLVIRVLIDHPMHGWQLISTSRALALYRGEKRIVELGNQTIRVATAHVIMERNVIRSLKRLTIDLWKFDSDGQVDQAVTYANIAEELHPSTNKHKHSVEQKHMTDYLGDADIQEIYLALGLAVVHTK